VRDDKSQCATVMDSPLKSPTRSFGQRRARRSLALLRGRDQLSLKPGSEPPFAAEISASEPGLNDA
jgi:hypothetical protein